MNQRSTSHTAKKPSGREKVPDGRVLRSALELFSSRGYAETTMKDIARDVGLSVGALYLRFRSKEELCIELIRDQTKDYDHLTTKIVSRDDAPLDMLRNYVRFNLDYALQRKQLLSLFMREHRLPFLQPLREKFFTTQQEVIRNILQAGAQGGAFRTMHYDDMALMIFGSIRGAIMLKIIFGTGSPEGLSHALFDLISKGVRKELS